MSLKKYLKCLPPSNYFKYLQYAYFIFFLAADAMVSTGLASVGYEYINIGIILSFPRLYLKTALY